MRAEFGIQHSTVNIRHVLLALWFVVPGAITVGAQETRSCLDCHSAALYKPKTLGEKPPPFVDPQVAADNVHARNGVACEHCHVEAKKVPHPPNMAKAVCAECHKAETLRYKVGVHGTARSQQIAEAASCMDCHGAHDMYARTDPRSHTHASNVEKTCLRCHTNEEMAQRFNFTRHDIGPTYDQSVHGRMIAAGHEDAATCNDCHGAHDILPSRDPNSRANRANIPKTCGACHWVVLDLYKKSIHGQNFLKGSADAPVCNTCHQDHRTQRVESDLFKLAVVSNCGNCHQDLLRSYRLSYHGKIRQLGGTTTARCSDCHGSHGILPVSDPNSMVSKDNIVGTCQRCHAGANANFAKYEPHADYLNRRKFPIVFYAWLFMITLLVGTLSFFTLHTILWFIRTTADRLLHPATHAKVRNGAGDRYVWRFNLYHRLTHGLVIISFLGLTVTGFPLKYSYTDWAHTIFESLGGARVAGHLHRFFALLTVGYAVMHGFHLWRTWRKYRRNRGERREAGGEMGRIRALIPLVFGPSSMMFNWSDLKQFLQHVRWFLFLGPRPKFDRWTYWEKFDYWGEMWGIVVIGATGFMLWFPLLVSRFLPGWIFNVATVVHSIEALLAAGVIFTVHFFNAHVHPDKFPMDDVIFTGTMPEHQFIEERPLEYERLLAQGRLEQILADPPSRRHLLFNRIVGFAALSVGVGLIICILYAEILQHFFLR